MAENSAGTQGLCAHFNRTSRKIHTLSNSLVNAKLVALFSDRELYGKALACFYYVFAALEAALDQALNAGDPDMLQFREPLKGGLYRAVGFRQDLEYYLGKDWEAACPKSKALQEYEHLAAASGGQIVKRAVRKHFRLPEDAGTSAFDFPGESNNTLRSQLKSKLDAWGRGLSSEEVEQLTDEHLAAFAYNNGIIRAFPVSTAAMLRGLLRVLPQRLLAGLLAALVLVMALLVAGSLRRSSP
ncbi:hypothetical protein GPECTOR_55g328 [Gonium pectorale]|uniref:Heme oxygenase n=1 Tax=Gonium pectorale TaxID=33097 RepID=A0A150G6E7_GONPE|nr:hypothetical protein GPECTOR_55g328 [Gonium pectorale]|eukprot:KXZ45422.1 hypothetical protein GPECTOR_55g328 [Gonium pectorale]